MKYSIQPIDTNQWLHIINREADPDVNKFEIGYYKLGEAYVLNLNSGFGSFMSPQFNKKDAKDKEIEAFFEKETENIKKQYEIKKGLYAQYQGLMSPVNPTGMFR